ncbi:MAG: hypothetical protein LQ340_002678 [Diploschistes diacapsis]|nr:MAG: hypothetical protein LQ340_002678 [Diploschistes diacapsis]
MPPLSSSPVQFGKFIITSQVFYLTQLSMAFVNLKPLLPGHVLVSPRRVVPRLSDLSQSEITDLFVTVQRVGKMVERVFYATSLNIAMQDGADAGQSVPHVHAHIIPRKAQDLEERGGGDAIYAMLEGEEGDVGKHLKERNEETKSAGRSKFPKVDEAGRKSRSDEEMAAEAEDLRKAMEEEAGTGEGSPL